jgi:FlaA1/EpsC-like NDP-sugar epimerase
MLERINWRNNVAFLHDIVAVVVAWVLGYLLRFNFEIYDPYGQAMLSNLVWVAPVQAGIFLWLRMYRGLWRYASLPDLRRILTAAVLGAMSIAAGVALLQRPDVPRSVLVLYPQLLAAMMGGSRIAYRAWKEGHLRRIDGDGKRVIVLGAGTAAANLLKSLGRSPDWYFIGLLDDDPTKLRSEIQGVRVIGTLSDLPEIASREGAEIAVIAMPDQTHRARRRALELSRNAGLQAMTGLAAAAGRAGRPARPRPGRTGCRWPARVAGRSDDTRDRRGGLDRRRALPADPALRSRAARRPGAE